jgi:TRAP transporter TAXI family solute receptor
MKDTGVKTRIVSEDSIYLRMQWLKNGDYFACSLEAKDVLLEAIGDYATRNMGPWQVRQIYALSEAPQGFAVRGDSDIKTPYDIKPGTKIAYFTFAGPMGRWMMEALLDWGNVDLDGVEWIPVATIDASARALMDGRADVMFAYPSSPAQYEVEASPRGLAWIELDAVNDPDGADRFLLKFPSAVFGEIGRGVPSAIGVNGMVQITSLATRDDADEELVYNLVKWMDENHDLYQDTHPSLPAMTVETTMKNFKTDYVPLHEGTIKYLKEIGVWTEACDERQKQNVDLIGRYIEAYQSTIDLADVKGIRVNPENQEWIDLWENYKKEQDLPRFTVFKGLKL